jgi:hypothetical protein
MGLQRPLRAAHVEKEIWSRRRTERGRDDETHALEQLVLVRRVPRRVRDVDAFDALPSRVSVPAAPHG